MQTIKKNWVYIFFAAALLFFIMRRLTKKEADTSAAGKVHITVKAFQINGGWGYEIYKGDSLFIRQESIPAIQGNKAFATKEDAEKIGDLAASKVPKFQFPTISVQELDSCKIAR